MEKVVTISKKGQIVIGKKLRELLGVETGDSILLTVLNGKLVGIPKPKKYTEYMIGLHGSVWEDIDSDDYLKQERDSWKKAPGKGRKKRGSSA